MLRTSVMEIITVIYIQYYNILFMLCIYSVCYHKLYKVIIFALCNLQHVIWIVCTCQIGLVFVTRSMQWVILSLFGVFVTSLFMATFTSIGFPYRSNVANPTRQRLTVNVSLSRYGIAVWPIILCSLHCGRTKRLVLHLNRNAFSNQIYNVCQCDVIVLKKYRLR